VTHAIFVKKCLGKNLSQSEPLTKNPYMNKKHAHKTHPYTHTFPKKPSPAACFFARKAA